MSVSTATKHIPSCRGEGSDSEEFRGSLFFNFFLKGGVGEGGGWVKLGLGSCMSS